jgi:ubiquinone/menaquinone biosynthesis C-methylase UbiE
VRRFSPEYLRDTRRGLWDDRSALGPLDLDHRTRILDVGAGTGEFTHILREASPATVVAVDADWDLLRAGEVDESVVGDATRLPFRTDAFDLVVCQALLINLPEPAAAIREFARVSSELVAAVEPDNSDVTIESSVESEPALARRARNYYMAGLETDVSLGPRVSTLFRDAGLRDIQVTRTLHERSVNPPYSDAAVESARRKATASRLTDQRTTMLRGQLSVHEFESLRDDWQAMGRTVVDQMAGEEYRRRATVPFYVTAGRVG